MSEYCQPIPRSIAFECLRARIRELRDAGEKLPKRLCAASYLFDLQSKKGEEAVKTQADYARIWGWSKAWVSDHIDEIREEALAQAEFYETARAQEKEHRDEPSKAESRRELRSNEARTPAERRVNDDPPTDDTDPEKTATRERGLNGEKTERERRINTNRSHYSDYQSKEDEDDGAPAREETSFDDFLDEKQRGLYLDDLRGLLEKYPSAKSCDLVWTKIIQTRRGPSAQRPIPRRWLINQAEEHGWPRLLAALWITSQKADKPNQNYARRILTSFDEDSDGNHRPRSRGHDRRNGRGGNRSRDPASDFEHNRRLAERAFAD
jgi:hypothetical protein